MDKPIVPTNKASSASALFRVPLALRIFLLSAVLILLAVGAAVFFTWQQGQKISRAAIERSIMQSAELQSESTQSRLAEVEIKSQLIAADPAFAEYVECASGQTIDMGGACSQDFSSTASIIDLLDERQESLQFDLAIVVDQAGALLARTDLEEPEALNLSNDPFVGPLVAQGGLAPAFMQFDEKLYYASGVSLKTRDEVVVGYVILGLQVDDEVSKQIAKYSGSQIAYWLPTAASNSFIASSLDAAPKDELSKLIATNPVLKAALEAAKSERNFDLKFAGETWIAQVRPVEEGAPKELGSVLSMTSRTQTTSGYDSLLNRVLFAGLGSLLIALPLSLLLSLPVLKPLRLMADAAEKAAAGDFTSRIGVRGKDALARLSNAFDSLLATLREKDEMEGYVGNLSRLLPESNEAPTSSASHPLAALTELSIEPELVSLNILALEYRQLAAPLLPGQLSRRAEEFEMIERRVNLVARQHGSRVVHNSGNRFVVGFSGSQSTTDALSTFRDLLDAPDVVDTLGASAPAGALVQGDALMSSGAPEYPSGPVLLGTAAFQSDRLLTESAPGLVIVGKVSVEWMASHYQVAPVTHRGSVSARGYHVFDRTTLGFIPKLEMSLDANATQFNAAASVPSTQRAPAVKSLTADLMPGERFGGRYQILSILGSGGMGVVYKARDTDLDDIVALKMLRTNLGIDAESLERLKSELKLARKISHPNVLKTYDFGLIEQRPFLSMEYIRGMTLRYLLQQAERIPYSAALRIAKQVCAGLVAAHEQGVLHRDIKPENVIIEPSGNAKLMDFGIARPTRRSEPGQTQPGMFVGTPRYSSPEQLAGEEVDIRSDVYAMGILLSEMFCGGFPFAGSNTMEIYLAQMQQAPVRPSEMWAEIPQELEAIIVRCIERERDKRFQTARDLSQSLSALRA